MALDKKYFDELANIITDEPDSLKSFIESHLHKKGTCTTMLAQMTAMLKPENCGLTGEYQLAVVLGLLEGIMSNPTTMSEVMAAAGGTAMKEVELKKALEEIGAKMQGPMEKSILDAMRAGAKSRERKGEPEPASSEGTPVKSEPGDIFRQEKHPDEAKLNELLKKVVDMNKGKKGKKLFGGELLDQIEVLVSASKAEKGVVFELHRQLGTKKTDERKKIISDFVSTLL